MPESPGALAARVFAMERRMDALESLGPKIDAVHRALLEAPPGEDEPLIRRIRQVVDAAENGSWAMRWAIRIVLSLGAIAGALAALGLTEAIRGVFR